MSEAINTHGLRMRTGKYGPKGKEPGMLLTRVPLDYLWWMVDAGHQDAAIAQAELDRRGAVKPEIKISGHAIDRASLACRKIWHQTAKDANEGLHAWLHRVSLEALGQGFTAIDRHGGENEVVKVHLGMKFAFQIGEVYPSLKTVMPIRPGAGKEIES